MKNQELNEQVTKDISELIKLEFKYANYAVKLKEDNLPFAEALRTVKKLKHDLIALTK